MAFDSNWYNRDGEVIDVLTANRLLGDPDYKRVALTEITSTTDSSTRLLVSTVWLGMNHNYGDGEPILFETMVFEHGDTSREEWARRHHTDAEALAGHNEIVTVTAATIPNERITHLKSWPGGPR
ncbi:hypothetical protein ACFZB5_13585 [Streptomyces nodosus]|uniref:hypothetical protein n=1 Tax=Streptomyces nodosus TaxID=40318 RepID=UPI0036EF7EFD